MRGGMPFGRLVDTVPSALGHSALGVIRPSPRWVPTTARCGVVMFYDGDVHPEVLRCEGFGGDEERFARQYRYGPPPEFPLASPRSGIVHHLSGPDRHAHTRTLLKRSESVGGAPHKGDPTNQLPYALRVYSPVDSHTCQTPWSVFQDGLDEVPAGRCQEHAGAEARRYSARCQP
ncbi:hypothetical protein E3N88_44507 [Mikania micrantha]|uniref:Uncharacterized protein n=1 Tax=Mikania micrantha TaxID=192012 RepID=A0A5N6LC20_9ASTR|nr:hypothetical protein E3N88_44507 [Mikania micrantha]